MVSKLDHYKDWVAGRRKPIIPFIPLINVLKILLINRF